MSSLASFKREGVWSLFFIQIFATLAYAVLYSTLVIYATKHLGLSSDAATSIIASYVAFNFALHLLGGYLGGRFLSFRGLFVVCTLFQIAGTLILTGLSINTLYIGLAVFLAGSGFNSICINCMLTQLFKTEEKELRQTAFLWNYSAMNFGFLVGFFMAGFFQISENYLMLFIFSSLANVIALIITFVAWGQLKDVNTHLCEPGVSVVKRAVLGSMTSFIVALALVWLLKHATVSSQLIMWLGVLALLLLGILAQQQTEGLAKRRLWAFNILMIASVIFFSLWQLLPMALTLFVLHNVNRMVMNFSIPPQWFLNVDSIVVIVGAPLIALAVHRMRLRGINVNIPALFSAALVSIGIAFVVLWFGVKAADASGLTSSWWVVFSYFLLAVGELCLAPVSYSMVGLLAPARLRGVLMGVVLLTQGVAATVANSLSQLAIGNSNSDNPLLTNPSYEHTFIMLGIISIVAGLILICFVPFILRLIQERAAAVKN